MSRSAQFSQFGPPSVIEVIEVEEPHAQAGQVRVAVRRAGLNPVDSKLRAGELKEMIPIEPPSGLGNEFSGVVDEVGDGAGEWQVGDEVFGTAPFRSLADYVVVEPGALARRQAGASWDALASLGVAGTTGYNSFSSLGIGPGDVVLVSAAAGGVGGVASQLAKRAGATVIGTASEDNHDYLRSLGIVPVAYGPGLAERVREVAPDGVAAALENHGSDAIEAALELGAAPSRINTVVGNAEQYGIGSVGGSSDSETLSVLGALVASGELSIPIEGVFSLDYVVAAYERLDEGHLRGKVVVSVSD
jgi:NADPH:quinone reductase-like Zn-dependent oxidoreductase